MDDVEGSLQVARRALEPEVTGAFFLETVRRGGRGLRDAAGDERVTVTTDIKDASVGIADRPEIGVEGQQTVAVVVDAGIVTTAGGADDVVESGEGRAEAVTAIEVEPGVVTVRVEIAELEVTADGGAVQGVVDEEVAVGAIADEDVLLGEAVQQVAAHFEAAVVEIDREATGIETERAGRGHANGAAVDADARGEGVLVVLQPERRAVDQAGLGDTILGVVVVVDLTGNDDVTVAREDHGAAGAEVDIAREGGDTGDGGEARLLDAAAETDGAGESDVTDGDQRTGTVDGTGTATARADGATEGQSVDGVRRLHDERTAAVTRATRAGHAGDGDRTNATAQLRRGSDDKRAPLDEDATVQRIRVVGQHQRAVARLDEAGGAGELRRDRHARTEVDAQRRRIEADRRGEREASARQLVIITRGEVDAREDETADRDVFTERDFRARAREITDVVGRESVVDGSVRAADRRAGTGVDPSRTARVEPTAGAAGARRDIVGVPEDVRGLGGLGRADGEQRGGDHERGTREEGTRLRTFH